MSILPAVPFGLPEPNDWFYSEEKAHQGIPKEQLARRAERLEDFEKVRALLLSAVFRAAAMIAYVHASRHDIRAIQEAGDGLLKAINSEGLTFDQDGRGSQIPSIESDPYQGLLNEWLRNTQRLIDNMSKLQSLRERSDFILATNVVATQDALAKTRDLGYAFPENVRDAG